MRIFTLDGSRKPESTYEGGKAVSPTHRPTLPPGNIPGTHFCQRLGLPQGHSAAGRIMSMKNSNDTVRNRIRDVTTCEFFTLDGSRTPRTNRMVLPLQYLGESDFIRLGWTGST